MEVCCVCVWACVHAHICLYLIWKPCECSSGIHRIEYQLLLFQLLEKKSQADSFCKISSFLCHLKHFCQINVTFKRYLELTPAENWKIHFFPIENITHTVGQSPSTALVHQHKVNFLYLICTFYFILFVFYLNWFSSPSFTVCFIWYKI